VGFERCTSSRLISASAPDLGVLVLAGATLILALAVLVIRFASNRFPSPSDGEVARGEVAHGEVRDE
jgi:hypothetical protein